MYPSTFMFQGSSSRMITPLCIDVVKGRNWWEICIVQVYEIRAVYLLVGIFKERQSEIQYICMCSLRHLCSRETIKFSIKITYSQWVRHDTFPFFPAEPITLSNNCNMRKSEAICGMLYAGITCMLSRLSFHIWVPMSDYLLSSLQIQGTERPFYFFEA